MRSIATFLCGLVLAGVVRAEAPPLRIGLVLSGGGARGTSHVGVLKVLDQLHVHVDAIAGTSMGAVVGGLYASGLSGAQIEKLLTSVDWQDAFRDRPSRADLGFRRKQDEQNFLVNLPLGLRGRKLLIPAGLIQGQKLNLILRRATLPVAQVTQFDRLPIPFRAVATDLETGAAVIMDSGDLTTAMRASMAAPGVLTPVERDGRLLVDGGLAENLPVDVARAMGVDVLIVVDAGFPLQTRDKLNSLTSVSNQALAILVHRDTERQRASLQANDVLLTPQLADVASYDFSAVARALKAGEEAARGAQSRLAQLAQVSASPAQPPRVSAVPLPVVSFVGVEPGSARYATLIHDFFGDQIGKPLQPPKVNERIETLYGRGNLESLDYRLVSDGAGGSGLLFTARRKSWGPNYLRLGLSLQDDFNGNSQFNAAARLTMTEIDALDAEWVWDLKIGASPLIASEFYQPLSNQHGFFFAPHFQAEEHDVPKLTGTLPNTVQVGVYRASSFEYGLDAGRELGNWGEVRAGLLDARGNTRLRLGEISAADPVISSYHMGAGFVHFSYDRLDSAYFPRSGQALSLNFRAEESGGVDRGSDLLTLDWRAAWSQGKNTEVAWFSGGSTVGGSVTNLRSFFPLGGFLNLSGLSAQSLAGPQYAIGRALYLRSVGNGGEGVLNVPAYAGVSLELGNVWTARRDLVVGAVRKDAALFFGADTYIGPVYLAAGYDEDGHTAFYLFLGQSF